MPSSTTTGTSSSSRTASSSSSSFVSAFVVPPPKFISTKQQQSQSPVQVAPVSSLYKENNNPAAGAPPAPFSSNQFIKDYAAAATATTTTTALALSKNDPEMEPNDENKDKDKKDESNGNGLLKKYKSSIKQSYKKALVKFINIIPTLKVAFTSFTIGIIMTFTLIFIPVYNSVDKMSEPVTLFETILTDLDNGYVDAVDTKKLFETGISAMLNSLDPYTEFEGRQEAKDMSEGISGKYAGVGLVISGASLPQDALEQMKSTSSEGSKLMDVSTKEGSRLLPKDAMDDNVRLNMNMEDDLDITSNIVGVDDDDDEDFDREDFVKRKMEEKRATRKAFEKGIRVVSAFEGYAFDAGMRPGDKIVAIDGWRVDPGTPVEAVRSRLRGEPGTSVDITFERDGVKGENTLSIPRNVVQVRDVKLTTFLGKPEDGIGYIQLSGFAANAGNEVRRSIFALQQAAEEASGGEHSLQVRHIHIIIYFILSK